MKKEKDYIISSGNIFEDLGFANPEQELAKVRLAHQINTLIEKKNLTQVAAAKLLDIDQPKISALSKGKLAGFSMERLFRFLNILGQDVVIKTKAKPRVTKRAVLVVNPVSKKTPTRKQPNSSPRAMYAQKKK